MVVAAARQHGGGAHVSLSRGDDTMNFGSCVWKVVLVDFSQQHRAFDSFGFGQRRGFFFGELKHGPTDAAGLRVAISPPPVFDEFGSVHGFLFDRAGLDLRQGAESTATFRAQLIAVDLLPPKPGGPQRKTTS